MKENSFDNEIIKQLSEILPPEDEVKNINPWSKPIGFITWGFILTTLKLDFLLLQYLLPTIGIILVFLGFRSLRNENKYLKVLWVFSIIKLFIHLADFLIMASPLNTMDFPEVKLGSIMLIFQIAMFLIFQKALNEVYKRANKPIKEQPLIWVSIWTIGAFFIALSPLSQSWLVFIPMIGFYIGIVKSLYKVGEQLDDTGYLLKNSPVKISNKAFGWSYLFIVLIIVLAFNSYFNHLKVEPREFTPREISQGGQKLIKMGFPKEAAKYLSDEEVDILSEAVNIEAISKLLMFDPKRIEHETVTGSHTYASHTYEPGKRNVEATTVYIEMPESEMYLMQYFTWQGGKPLWHDVISITGENDTYKEIISSSLFYSKDDIEYLADFPWIACEDFTTSNMFGTYNYLAIRASLNYPFGSKNQGGYVLYRYKVDFPDKKDNIFSSHADFSYVHSKGPIKFPYKNIEERIASYEFIDELNWHYTSYESLELREINE